MFDRFSEDARNAMVAARQAAQRLRHDFIGTEHLLLGLLAGADSPGVRVLRTLGVDPAEAARATEAAARRGDADPHLGQLPFTPRAKQVLEAALEEALELRANFIGTEHLLLGLVRTTDGIAAQVLLGSGVTLGRARALVKVERRAQPAGGDAAHGAAEKRATPHHTMPPLIRAARDAAAELGHRAVGTEHLLLAIAASEGAAGDVLRETGVTREKLHAAVVTLRRRGTSSIAATGFSFTPHAIAALEDAEPQAAARATPALGPEHVLLALLAVHDGLAVTALADVGVGADTLREALVRRLGA